MISKHRAEQTRYSLLLLLTAVIWGLAFVAQRVGTESVGPWTFLFSRYVLSTVALIPFTLWDLRRLRQREAPGKRQLRACILGGVLCGLFLGLASWAQQVGLMTESAGKSGFLTALYVVLVPVMGLLIGKRPPRQIWLCVALGIAGMYLISVKEGFAIGSGDRFLILCAFLFALQIMTIDHFSQKAYSVVLLANVQFAVTMLVGLAGMLACETFSWENILAAGPTILYAGLLSGAVGYTLQMITQKHLDPTVASLIMCLESIFSALSGYVILGEVLTGRELAGCALTFMAAVLAQLPWEHKRNEKEKTGAAVFDPAAWTPVIRSSICTGEKTAGFRENATGQIHEVMLISCEKNLETFRRKYDIRGKIETIY